MNYEEMYDNVDGYTNRSIQLANDLERHFVGIFKEYSEFNALQLAGLVHGAVHTAFLRMSIERRLCEHQVGKDIFDKCRNCGVEL